MTPRVAATRINAQIYQEAADWLVSNRGFDFDRDEARRKSFDLWLRASPEHIRAYLELTALWEDLSMFEPGSETVSELVTRARTEDNIARLDDHELAASDPSSGRAADTATATTSSRRLSRSHAIAASLVAVLAAAVLSIWSSRDPSYSTDVGEQRTITLADGSTVELDSASRIRVDFTAYKRAVVLVRGQALFHVVRNPERPFIVSAGRVRVRDVGTQFDVYKKSAATVVTVLEGEVAIIPPHEPGQAASGRPRPAEARRTAGAGAPRGEQHQRPILLSAGEQLTVTLHEESKTLSADLAAATAWTRHDLVFTDAPLTEVAEEFNRYNSKRLLIADPQLAELRISGVFSSADPALLIRFLRKQDDLEVEETDSTILVSRR